MSLNFPITAELQDTTSAVFVEKAAEIGAKVTAALKVGASVNAGINADFSASLGAVQVVGFTAAGEAKLYKHITYFLDQARVFFRSYVCLLTSELRTLIALEKKLNQVGFSTRELFSTL